MPQLAERIYVAGHGGLVGSAIVRALAATGHATLLTRARAQLDLLDQRAVRQFFEEERPTVVYLAAAKVGGIQANNTFRWDFMYENLAIEVNILSAALATRTHRVAFFGSSCIYPKLAPQPIREEDLLTGPLEPTNEPYAIAKIAGLKLVEAANAQFDMQWVSLMPTNLYGPGDNFELSTSHVLPAMIRRFHEAKVALEQGGDVTVKLWGTGSPRREFLHVDDLARAALHLVETGSTGLFNVGFGSDMTIREASEIVASVVGYDGPVEWDTTKPDGTPRKLLDSSRITATGWSPGISFERGVAEVYEWYRTSPAAHPGR